MKIFPASETSPNPELDPCEIEIDWPLKYESFDNRAIYMLESSSNVTASFKAVISTSKSATSMF